MSETIDEKIEKLGPAFRGLWKSVTIYSDLNRTNSKEEGWACTFILNREVVETEYCTNPRDALEEALIILKKETE